MDKAEGMVKANWHGPKQVRVMIYCLLMFFIGSVLISGMNNTVFPWIADYRGWDVNGLRRMSGYGSMVTVVGVIVFSRIMRRVKVNKVNSICLILTTFSLLLFGFTKNYVLFCTSIMCNSFLASTYFMCGNSALTANWWPTKKGVVLGITSMGVICSDMIWCPFAPRAFSAFGLSQTMVVVAILVCILGIVGLLTIPSAPEEVGEYPDGDPANYGNLKETLEEMKNYKSPWTVGKILKDRGAIGIAFGMGIMWLSNMTYVISIVPRLLSVGYEYNFATFVLAICGIFACVGSYVMGLIDQKFGTKKACIIFSVLLIFAIIVARFHAASVICVWVAGICFSAANGAVVNLVPSAVTARFGRWDFKAAYGVVGAITGLLSGIGILCTGIFRNYQLMYTMDLFFYIIGFVIVTFVMDLKLVGKAN